MKWKIILEMNDWFSSKNVKRYKKNKILLILRRKALTYKKWKIILEMNDWNS